MTVAHRVAGISASLAFRHGSGWRSHRTVVKDSPMGPGSGKKIAVIISDNEALARALEVNLARLQGVEVSALIVDDSQDLFKPEEGEEERYRTWQAARRSDLLVIAMVSLLDDPLVAMARLGLLDRVGRVPLLIISYGPSRSIPDFRIRHLAFPFKAEELLRSALEMLGMPAGGPEVSA